MRKTLVKKGLLVVMIIAFCATGFSSTVQGYVFIDDKKWDVVTDSINTTIITYYCGTIHNLSKFGNLSLFLFFSHNMRQILYWKIDNGDRMVWYIRSVNENMYALDSSLFRGILTPRLILGYTVDEE